MNQLEDMRYLVETVDRNGFSAAAQRLGVSKQLVSRRISELEARLGVQLLIRTTRRLTLTELGTDYLDHARSILASVDDAERSVSSHHAAPRGLLRVSAPVSFATLHLSSLIVGFLERYPEVRIELDLNDRAVDLVAEGYDMAVRIGTLRDSTLVARKLVDMDLVICASPAYLHRRSAPRTIADLKDHDCLLYGHNRAVSWTLTVDGALRTIPMTGVYRTNNGELIRDAVGAGLGLAQLPDFILGNTVRTGELVTVLDEFAPSVGGAYVVYPAHRQRSATVRALGEHLVDHFRLGGARLRDTARSSTAAP